MKVTVHNNISKVTDLQVCNFSWRRVKSCSPVELYQCDICVFQIHTLKNVSHFYNKPTNIRETASSVGIATRYGLDSPGTDFWLGARFSAPVQTGPRAHPALIQKSDDAPFGGRTCNLLQTKCYFTSNCSCVVVFLVHRHLHDTTKCHKSKLQGLLPLQRRGKVVENSRGCISVNSRVV